nr:uncharacterized protein LOC114820910 [Malus domestica]
MAEGGGGELRAPIFNRSNYDFWMIKLRTIFISQDLWKLVEKGYVGPEMDEKVENDLTTAKKLALKDNVTKDAKALGLIQNAVSDDIFPHIAQQNDESLSMYVSKLFELVNQMRSYGEELFNQRTVQKLLISIPRSYDSIAELIEETKDTDTIGVQDVMGSLKSHEQRLQRHADYGSEKAFSSLSINPKEGSSSSYGGSSKFKNNWKNKGKKMDVKPANVAKKDNQGEGTKTSCVHCNKLHYGTCWFKEKPKCHKCDRFGHLANDYKSKIVMQQITQMK